MDADRIIAECLADRVQRYDKYCSVALALKGLRDIHRRLNMGADEAFRLYSDLLGSDESLCNYRIGRRSDFSTPYVICALRSREGDLYGTFDQMPDLLSEFAKGLNLCEARICGRVEIDHLGCLHIRTPYDNDWLAEIIIDLTKCKELQLVSCDGRIRYRISVFNDIFNMIPEMEIFHGFLFDQEEGGQ